MTTRLMAVLGGGVTLALAAALPATAQGVACGDVTARALGVSDVTVTDAAVAPAEAENPVDHCIVRGMTQQRTGTDGKPYAIRFELRLPDAWNGRFVHQFNGGNDGTVEPAFGPLLGGDESDTALARGYAVVSSDAGHQSDANPDAGLAGGARFGLEPRARMNYGYGAVATLHPLAERMVSAYYDAEIAYTYGVGGSNGGRHAMVAAARMPESFDGLLVGYPGFNLPKAAVQHAWDVQAFKQVANDVKQAFSRAELDFVARGILESCDALDGLEDGIINATDACQEVFDPASLSCADADEGDCLSSAQVTALEKIHAGPTNSKGEQLYARWNWDRGIASEDWRFWKLESGIPPWNGNSLISVMGAASLAQIFTTPPTQVEGTPDALETYLAEFDFDADAPKIHATDDTLTESAMEMMTPPGSADPELAPFRENGGKMVIFHGVSDPVFSVVDTTNWYEKLDANNGDAAGSFVRYYRVPGMPHGAGGPATDDFDMFTPLVAWVEGGEQPGAIRAGVSEGNEEAREAGLAGITRPLCPYPRHAEYVGGEPAAAASFACR